MVEPIRFYTDENVGRSVASGLRRRGVADMQNHVEFL
jgi:hypothetical protein